MIIKVSHQFFRMVVNNLPTQEVKSIGRKLEGFLGSSFAVALGIRQITPCFYCEGKIPAQQQLLKRSNRAGIREGQRLNTKYGVWSTGLGEDCERVLLMAAWISSMDINSSLIA